MTAYEFRCPFGLVFDQDRLICEWPWLVPKCASGYASSGGVLVEFHGGAYGSHGGVVGVNGVINGDDGRERTGYRLRGAYIKPSQGVVLENYNGLGVLQPVALGGLHGPISEPISKVYSSFGSHGGDGQNGVGHGGNVGVLVGVDAGHRLAGGNIQDGHQNLGQGGLIGVHGDGYANADQGNVLVGIGSAGHQKIDGQNGLVGIGGEYDAANANAGHGNVLVGIGSSDNLGHSLINHGVTHQNIAGNGGGQGVLVGVHNGGIGGEYSNAGQGHVLVGIDSSDNLGHGLAGANVDQGITHQNTAYTAGNSGDQGVLVGVHNGGISGEYSNAGQGNVLVGIHGSENLRQGLAGANVDHQNTEYTAGNAGSQGVLVGVHNGGIGGEYSNAGQDNVLVGIDNSDNVGQSLAGANLDHASSYQNQGNAGQGVLIGVHNVGHSLAGADINNGGFISGIDHGAGRSELNQGSSQLDSLNRGSIRFNAGLRNDAGKSINQVTYHGNLALSGNADGQSSLGDSGYVEGERILSAVQDVNSGVYRGSHRGSAKYQTNQQLGDGQSTVTYHGNFGNVGRNEEGQVLDDGVALVQGVQGVDHNVGVGFDQGNYGNLNSQLDRASAVFGTKLRGSKAGGDGAVFTGEKFVSNYIQNGHEQDGSKLGVLIGEQNLGIQDGAGKISQSTVTYHGNTGASNSFGVDQGAGNIGLEHGVIVHGNQDSFQEGVEHRSEGGKILFYAIPTNLILPKHITGSLQYNLDDGRDHLGGVTLLNNGRDSSSRSYQNFNSQHNSGKVNIVKGGFSAVGVYPNTYKQSTPSLSTITASPISVTPVPVTASPIPVVTSVPIPTTHINDNLDVYNGNGVVANVPELQVKVETPSAVVIPNIQRTHTASTGAALEVDNGGYVYDKPAVSFVEGGDSKFVGHSGAKSYIQQNIEHRQPFLTDVTPSIGVQPVSVNIPQQRGTTSYHFGQTSVHQIQPSLDLENQKVLLQPQIAIKQNVIGSADINGHSGESYSYQNFDKSTIINHATPSILVDQKIARPSPTISSVHFGTALVDQPNPSIVVQPAVESVSTIRPVLIDNIHQHKSTFIETATPSVSVQPVRTASPVFVENVTPIAPIRPVHFELLSLRITVRPVTYSTKQDSILTQQPVVSHGSFSFGAHIGNVHPVQNVEINKEVNVGFVENVTPAIVQQQPVILHQNPVPQGGASYFYQRNDFRKSTPSLPSASFSFQSLPARGFEKQVDVIENVTPAPILVQQEVKRPVSVVIGDNGQSNFLSSVSKSRGFSKFGQNIETGVLHETPFVPVTPVVNIAQSIQPIIPEGGNLNLGVKHRGFAKYTPTIIEATTPQPIAHQETVIGLNENEQGDNAFGTFAYDGFGLKTPNSESGYYESHHERTGYHYPKPAIRFEEGPVINQDYDNLEPVKEEPFMLKKAYITGNKYKSVTPTPIFVTSTVNPTYQSTIQSVYNTIPSTTVKPTNFYYYDNRFSSTPKPYEIRGNVVPTVTIATPKITFTTPKPIVSKIPVSIDYDFGTRSTVAPAIITESKPIFKYSFSSLDSQYTTTPAAPDFEVTPRPVINSFKIATPIISPYQPVSIKSTTVRPLLDVTVPSREYLPVHNVIENYRAPILNRKIVQPSSQAIVKVNDFHPLLSAKLGAQCTCIADSVRFRNKPVKVSIDDGETVEEFVVKPNNQPDLLGFSEGESIKDAYIGGDNINAVPDYESQKVVDITPLPEVTIGSTSLAPISRGPVIVRKRLRVRPVQSTTLAPVTKLADVFLTSTGIPDYEGISQQSAQNFDRYGPGGLRSKTERLQGTVDCQRAGLFRHPTQCNKFYSCRWDCTKNKFTLHVFNCPVHLTFDDSLGACNWPSQGPACLGNTLLPSD
ncbi:chitin binding peritrophin-a [Holotrichia oblita]|uniref:Chitin binding peritrophin-a n=1 Tax=Holotrichia oblita TaxID=644536 RepID=A0ACB9SPF2_HOLOL|nr:chitin binding peritrophin-a [Holotrichia oblita]